MMRSITRDIRRRAAVLVLALLLAACAAPRAPGTMSTLASPPAASTAVAAPTAAPATMTSTSVPAPATVTPTTQATATLAAVTATVPATTATPAAAGGAATPAATSDDAPKELRYYWPTSVPRGLVVQAGQSSATETSFVLELAEPGGGQFYATIAGGRGSRADVQPPALASRPVSIRGQPGVAMTTGAGFSLYWIEAGQPYAITGGLGLQDVQALADGLQALDLATWRQRLAAPGAGGTVAPATSMATYTHAEGRWSVRYPADLLHVEDLGEGVVVFISRDRGTVAAVDAYVAAGNAYGNTGEDLRNRARDTLARLYGAPIAETEIISAPGAPWETGLTFTTARGSKGTAVYQQRGRGQGDFRVHGFIYGYKAATEPTMLPVLETMRDSFR